MDKQHRRAFRKAVKALCLTLNGNTAVGNLGGREDGKVEATVSQFLGDPWYRTFDKPDPQIRAWVAENEENAVIVVGG